MQANATAHPKPETALTELSAVQAVAAMTRGELSVEQYASALLRRCEEEHSLNAFITLEPDRVLEAARQCDRERRARRRVGALFGLPIPVKDSVNTRDYPTTAGTPALRHFRPPEDAPVVQALRAAGAIVLGKTNLHELSWGWTSNNHAFGAVHNPYDPTRIPGGSSGGTAAAVAARIAPLGIAEDTEGSIRVPAALCGVVGFRPTTGRYSTEGAAPISALFDQVGPHARTVSDIVLFDSVLSNDWSTVQPTPLQGVRLGVVRDYWYRDLDPEIEEAAASLGANRWQTFWRVILPMLYPALLTGFSLAFARALGEYGSVVFIAGNMPMKTEITPLLIITKLEQFDYAGATALAVVMLVGSFAILLAVNLLQWRTSRHQAQV